MVKMDFFIPLKVATFGQVPKTVKTVLALRCPANTALKRGVNEKRASWGMFRFL
jgi:hypothetical protein